MSFCIGQRVVCVNDRFSRWPRWRRAARAFPKLNSIYTIREVCRSKDYGAEPFVAFCFYEIVNPPALFRAGYFEPSFLSKYFRPVKTTSIELFEKLLLPAGPRKEHRPKIIVRA